MSGVLARIGVIGGSAFSFADGAGELREHRMETPYGAPSSALKLASVGGQNVAMLQRHGAGHRILPHEINYRANLWALKAAGVEALVALATVGGIGDGCTPGAIVVPDQILDYTHTREHTFSPLQGRLIHIDFTEPYCGGLRGALIESADSIGVGVRTAGTYAATQGPRFESAAEIKKYQRDGADVVGMTGMPEACLAREIGICYAAVALVVNYAAGISGSLISVGEIAEAHGNAMKKVNRLLAAVLPRLSDFECRMPPAITP